MYIYQLNFRQYYQPMQPTAASHGSPVSYLEVLPAEYLQNYIYCYWQLKSLRPLSRPYIYNVVADGCIDLFFDMNYPDHSQVMGFSKAYTAFPLPETFNYAGVRFFPAVFPQLFNIKASELSNRTEQLRLLVPELADYIGRHMNPDIFPKTMGDWLDRYFQKQFSNINFDWDSRFYRALQIILAFNGNIQIEKELSTGLSLRQLRRLFQFHIGESGKAFCKVVRFQKLLASENSPVEILKKRSYFDLGYYDQPHFIKDFKRFYGTSPKQVRL